jgi:hypothetical protein
MSSESPKSPETQLLNQNSKGYLIGYVTGWGEIPGLFIILYKNCQERWQYRVMLAGYCLEKDAPELFIILLCALRGITSTRKLQYPGGDKSCKKELNSPTAEYSGQVGQWIGIN